ncbi:MAG: DM13 domain-containing protein [Pseudomonadota bacterium]
MRNLIKHCLLTAILSVLFLSTAIAENLYNPTTGDLSVAVIRIDANTAFSGRFSLVSETPLIWAGVDFREIQISSRVEATYNAASATLFVPEINVNQELFSLSFILTDNCDATICIEPQLDTLIAKGRDGGAIFTNALTPFSTFSCSSCHAISEANGFAMDGIRRAGHPLENATRRPTFKNGGIDDFLAAVNICVTEWMNGEPLASDDPTWINLQNWLRDQNTVEVADALFFQVVQPPAQLTGGDETLGRASFNKRCIVCHGIDGTGTQLAPAITNKNLPAELIARRVRTSGRTNSAAYAGLTGGVMPFWSADRLSDHELLDIIAYVAGPAEPINPTNPTSPTNPTNPTSPADPDENIMEEMDDPPDVSTGTGCTSTSSKIGQQAVFSTFAHDVSGTATIIDDWTIEITNFSFDGGGINVQIYLGVGGDFRESRGGFSSSGNLVGTPFSNGTLRITLPAGRTPADFDSISVWCVPVGASFGDGFFSS